MTRSTASRRLLLIVTTGILAGISTVLRFYETPLPMIPAFLQLDASNIPALIGGFAFGPVAGTAILLIKNLIYLPFTKTMGVGEVADFVISLTFVLTASLIYKYKKNRKGAIIGMAAGTGIMSFVAAPLMNYFALVPFYVWLFFNNDMEKLIELSATVNPSITSVWTYILFAVVPFNIIKCVAVSIATGILYKPLSPILHKYR